MTGAAEEKFLIVNADDFGMSAGINRAIVRAHVEGIVTSASLMVRWPAAHEAAQLAAAHPRLTVGLHLDLGEWEKDGDGYRAIYEVLPDTENLRAVQREADAQLREFRKLMGRDPTHLDSHQHTHRDDPARHVLWSMGKRLGIPVRHFDPRAQYCGAFYGVGDEGEPRLDRVSTDALKVIISNLPPGTTELCTHPSDGSTRSSYSEQRPVELQTLCDPAIRAALEANSVQLISYCPPAPHPLALRGLQKRSGWRAAWQRICSPLRQTSTLHERSSPCGLS